jgi:hypothetical protein
VTAGATALVRGVIRNFGPSRADGVVVRLTVDDRVASEQSVDLPVGENVPIVFNHQFITAGDHVVEILVDGDFKSEPFQAETDFLAQALAPSEGSPGQPGMIRVEVATESQYSRRDLGAYDVVALCNVPQFNQGEATTLEDFLKQGGGIVIFGGNQVLAENYNRLLHADGRGLLPAAIGATVGDATRKESAFGLDPLNFRHPLLAEFRGESDPVTAGLTRAISWQYHKLTIPKESNAQIALAFESGDPAVIEAPRFRGKVIQVATSADAGWTTWPLHNSYPPVMQQMILQAAAGRMTERNIKVGQPFDQTFAAAGAAAPVTILTPKRQALATKLKGAGGVSQLHFEQTELSGPYQVKIGPPLAVESSFAANPDPAESDPAKLDKAGLTDRLPGWSFTYLWDWKELTKSATSVGRRGELHRPLLYGALMLLFVESFLAWKFGHHDTSS